MILSLAAKLDWPLHWLDIKNALLSGELEEEVYTSSGNLRMASSNPQEHGLTEGGSIQYQLDHTMFVKHSLEGKVTLFIVYVDDIIITRNDHGQIKHFEGTLSQRV
ncbi:hypothetical protein CR513_22328, partial [Mucuna pruriens]